MLCRPPPVNMIASAVFLAALALACSDKGFWSATATLVIGMLLASLFDDRKPKLVVTISAACLLTYLAIR